MCSFRTLGHGIVQLGARAAKEVACFVIFVSKRRGLLMQLLSVISFSFFIRFFRIQYLEHGFLFTGLHLQFTHIQLVGDVFESNVRK